jgi:TM2 domain-containing membrane protein YozV
MSSKNWKKSWATVGSLLLDLGKLVFGSLILGSVIRGGFDPFQTFLFGTGIAIFLFVIGVLLVTKYKE